MMGSVLILTGPPGAGKSTVARLLADGNTKPTVHLHTDDFYAWIRKGYVAPYLREAQQQNEVVVGVIVAAAVGYARGGYEVIIDGIVGPWFLEPFRAAAAAGDFAFDYVVLRPSEAETVHRGATRAHARALRDENVISGMWKAFAALGPLEPHVLDTSSSSAEETARTVRTVLAAGRFRLS